VKEFTADVFYSLAGALQAVVEHNVDIALVQYDGDTRMYTLVDKWGTVDDEVCLYLDYSPAAIETERDVVIFVFWRRVEELVADLERLPHVKVIA
jgi:hypothetical protein